MDRPVAAALLLLRVFFGLILAAHGAAKLGNLSGFLEANGHFAGLGAIAGELLGGLGLAVGLFTRVAAAGLCAVMFTIAFGWHAKAIAAIGTGPGTAFEYPFLAGVLGVAFVLAGAGPYSLDALLRKRRR